MLEHLLRLHINFFFHFSDINLNLDRQKWDYIVACSKNFSSLKRKVSRDEYFLTVVLKIKSVYLLSDGLKKIKDLLM
jgi:hypothetical protein